MKKYFLVIKCVELPQTLKAFWGELSIEAVLGQLKFSKNLFPVRVCCENQPAPTPPMIQQHKQNLEVNRQFLLRKFRYQKKDWTYNCILLFSLSISSGKMAPPRYTGHVSWNSPFLSWFMSLVSAHFLPFLCSGQIPYLPNPSQFNIWQGLSITFVLPLFRKTLSAQIKYF